MGKNLVKKRQEKWGRTLPSNTPVLASHPGASLREKRPLLILFDQSGSAKDREEQLLLT